jgi:hypothetical protein
MKDKYIKSTNLNKSVMTKDFKRSAVTCDGVNRGYAAMATVLIVGFILLSSGIAVSLNSINESQSSFVETQREEVIGFVDSCVQDALIRLNENNAIPASIVLPDGACTVTINSQVGSVWDFTTTGTFGGYQKSIRVSATRVATVTITSWLEI